MSPEERVGLQPGGRARKGGQRSFVTEEPVPYASFPDTNGVKMVAITVSASGKPTINLDFANKHPRDVTVKELKAAIQAKFPKVIQMSRHENSSPQRSLVLACCQQTKSHRAKHCRKTYSSDG